MGDPPGNNWSGGSEGDINWLGSSVGLLTQSNGDQAESLAPPDADRRTAERYGERIAQMARHFAWEHHHETERLTAAHSR